MSMRATLLERVSTHVVRFEPDRRSVSGWTQAEKRSTSIPAALSQAVIDLFPPEKLDELLKPGVTLWVSRCAEHTMNAPLNETEPLRIRYVISHLDES